jgi:HAD superfamily hydrolase (TIGR01484 family)
MIITDLDGTLRRTDGSYGAADRAALEALGRRKITRVVATGRTLHAARKVLPPDFPIDYLVFSSGAGVLDWRAGEILRSHHLAKEEIGRITHRLLARDLDFMLHEAIPDTHRFFFRRSGSPNSDFEERCRKHPQYCRPWNELEQPERATQFLVVSPPEREARDHDDLVSLLPEWRVIRATSPLDGKSLWSEIFPRAVAKSLACAWLAERLGVAASAVLAVGNDYNDLDLLEWAGRPFLVANAPGALLDRFTRVASCDENGVAEALSWY